MTSGLLYKGIEVELYAGNESGEVVPLSGKLNKFLPEISQEPDQRNFEYITNPTTNYDELIKELILPRIKVRNLLKKEFDLTLIPGSTISLPFEKKFYPSKEDDLYHKFIYDTYKTNVITTSLHINFGIEDTKILFNLLSIIRLFTPLFLALSASSPFFDGKVTNYNSYRWHLFPHTPSFVPFFKDHDEYIKWTKEKLEKKEMYNVRHLWTAIRPNGIERPYKLNRLEIRICDLVSDVFKSVSIVGFIELLIQYYIENPLPSILNANDKTLETLVNTLNKEEEKAAKDGLNADLIDWRDENTYKAHEIISSLYDDLFYIGEKLKITKYLKPLKTILKEGNEATQFLNHYKKTSSINTTIQHFTKEFNALDTAAYQGFSLPTT